MATPSMLWIRQQAEEHRFSENPVGVILQVTFQTSALFSGDKQAQQSVRQRLSSVLNDDLSRPIQYGERQFMFRWYSNPQATGIPVHYISCVGYTDIVRATVMKCFFEEFNRRHVDDGHVEFLLSRPLDYIASI